MIDFMRWKPVYFLISALVILPGVFSLLRFGLKQGIDFTGGSVLQVEFIEKKQHDTSLTKISAVVGESMEVSAVQQAGGNQVIIKAKPLEAGQKDAALQRLEKEYGVVEEKRFENIGPVLGRELLVKTITAILLAALSITAFVAYRFRSVKYGVCAVLAMLHDTLVVIGVFSILGWMLGVEVDTLFVTALLTILSFSVHDTIVVYDRIRELSKKNPGTRFETLVNMAVTETMGRSINNSLTIILMLTALWLMGGETVKWFVFALLVGTITGTYSSTFTAAPLLVVWDKLKK